MPEINYTMYQNMMKEAINIHRIGLATEEMKQREESLKLTDIFMEFRTFILSFGRDCGHTTYIKNAATPKDLIVARNEQSKHYDGYRYTETPVFTPNAIASHLFHCVFPKNPVTDIIYIDGKATYDTLLSDYIPYADFLRFFKPNQIVVLGE